MRSIRVALATLAGVLVLGAATAAAETPNHAFLGTLVGGTEAVGPAPPGGSPPLAARLDNPCGVAVSSSGLVFTAEYTRARILAGQSRLAATFYPENGPCGLATDGAELFVNYFHGGVVLFGSGQIDPGPATGIAVDPATHDLYVDKRSSIAVYTAPVEPGGRARAGNRLGQPRRRLRGRGLRLPGDRRLGLRRRRRERRGQGL